MRALWILYVNGKKWGAYLTKEDAEESARRRKARGDKVKIMRGLEGFSDAVKV